MICEKIQSKLPFELDVIVPDTSLEVKAIIGQCQWIFSSRFHGCVSALSQNVPCLATTWSHKYEELFSDYEQIDWLVGKDLVGEKLALFLKCFDEMANQNSEVLKVNSNNEKLKSIQTWQQIQEIVNNY